MFNNPLIERYRYSTLRPKQLWVYAAIYVSIASLMMLITYSAYKVDTGYIVSFTELFRSLYYQFLAIQIFLLFAWSTYNSGSAIREDILNKSFDFFRMFPLKAYKKAIGILVGKNLLVFLFTVINFIFLICFGIFGEINSKLQGQVILGLISICVFLNSASLLCSINPERKAKNYNMLFVLLIMFFFVPMLVSTVIHLANTEELQGITVYFFNAKTPLLIAVSAVALYLSCWAFIGILRRFTREQEPLFSRTGSLLFLIGYVFILTGFYYHYLKDPYLELVISYWVCTFIPLLIIPLASLRRIEKYIEHIGQIQVVSRTGKLPGVFSILMYSNFIGIVGLFLIWAVCSIAVTVFADLEDMGLFLAMLNISVLCTSYILIALLIELYTLYRQVYSKIGLLLGFVAVLYMILPLIIGGIFDNRIIVMYSPFGFLGSLFETSKIRGVIKISYCLVDATFFVLPAVLIWNRYRYILEQRQKM